MNMQISGSGCLIPSEPVPDSVLALAYPHFIAEDSPDGGIWLTLTPYVEVYDEEKIRSFFAKLAPYIRSGSVACSLEIAPGHVTHWEFRFEGGHCFKAFAVGSCITYADMGME